MTSTLICTKVGGRLFPSDKKSIDILSKLPSGTEIRVEVKAKRNVRRHNLLFAVLDIVVDHEIFPSVDNALDCLKLDMGHVEMIVHPMTGEVGMKPKSIAFENMDETEYGTWLERALTLVCDRWLDGADKEDVRRHVYEIVDGDRASSLGRRAA